MTTLHNVVGGTYQFSDRYEIPRVGLGISRIPTQEALDVAVEAALRSGYRLFDTANLYKNEQYLGNSLRKYLPAFGLTRQDVFITTKLRTLNENTIQESEDQLAGSLEKLQTDYLDLVLVHYPRDRDTGNDDDLENNVRSRKIVWQFLERAKDAGRVRSIGLSNYEVYHLVELFTYARHRPVLNQYEYQPYLTRSTLQQFCRQNNIVLQAYSSLCWGDQQILQEPAVVALAQKYNVTVQAILYAFGYCSGFSIIPKSATPARIHDNLHVTIGIHLTTEDLNSLRALDRHHAFPPIGNTWAVL